MERHEISDRNPSLTCQREQGKSQLVSQLPSGAAQPCRSPGSTETALLLRGCDSTFLRLQYCRSICILVDENTALWDKILGKNEPVLVLPEFIGSMHSCTLAHTLVHVLIYCLAVCKERTLSAFPPTWGRYGRYYRIHLMQGGAGLDMLRDLLKVTQIKMMEPEVRFRVLALHPLSFAL